METRCVASEELEDCLLSLHFFKMDATLKMGSSLFSNLVGHNAMCFFFGNTLSLSKMDLI